MSKETFLYALKKLLHLGGITYQARSTKARGIKPSGIIYQVPSTRCLGPRARSESFGSPKLMGRAVFPGSCGRGPWFVLGGSPDAGASRSFLHVAKNVPATRGGGNRAPGKKNPGTGTRHQAPSINHAAPGTTHQAPSTRRPSPNARAAPGCPKLTDIHKSSNSHDQKPRSILNGSLAAGVSKSETWLDKNTFIHMSPY